MRAVIGPCVALALAACAHAPEVAVLGRAEAALEPGERFAVAGDDAAGQAVAAALVAKGYRQALPGETPAVVVQAAFAERPRGIGAFVPKEDGEPTWIARGGPPRPWTLSRGASMLVVAIHDRQGRERYRGVASQPHRKPADAEVLPRLAAAAVAPLGAQPAT